MSRGTRGTSGSGLVAEAPGRGRAQGARVAPCGVDGRTAPPRRRLPEATAPGHRSRLTRPGRDPGGMTPEERLAELGSLLATGRRRLVLAGGNALATSPDDEPTCISAVDGDGAKAVEEIG